MKKVFASGTHKEEQEYVLYIGHVCYFTCNAYINMPYVKYTFCMNNTRGTCQKTLRAKRRGYRSYLDIGGSADVHLFIWAEKN